MSQIKIVKQDILNSLKTNIHTYNISNLINEIKKRIMLNFRIEISQKQYMW